MNVITWITVEIEHVLALIKQLDPLTCVLLFLFYGVCFEWLYAKSLYAYRDFKRFQAANIGVVLFCLSLWGLTEAIKENVLYALPICIGSWLGTVLQVTIEKRRNETEGGASTGGDADKTEI